MGDTPHKPTSGLNQALVAEKRVLRRALRERRRAIPPEARAEASARLCAHLSRWLMERGAKQVGLFWPHGDEPDLRALAALSHKSVVLALPFIKQDGESIEMRAWCEGDALWANRFGIPEPDPYTAALITLTAGDVLLVPALALDHSGFRLGYGGGFYDRFLPGLPDGVTTVGVAFETLIVDRLPHETHDRPVEVIASEEGIRGVKMEGSPLR